MSSLLNAVRMSFRGLEHTQAQISVASQNITNADREGYSRKTFRADYITGNFGTAPVGGQLLSALNPFLLEGVVNDTTDVGRKNVMAEFLDVYVRRTGSVVSDFSLTSTLNDFFKNLDLLAVTPENRAQKEQIVSDAEVIALYLRDMSSSIQDQRTEIELEIDKSVDRINESLAVIHDLNDKILRTSGKNSTTLVEYEDQRATEVQKLAEEIDITFYVDGQNRIQIYHPSGQPMLLSEVRPVEFEPVASLSSSITYPTGIKPIEVNGIDITENIKGGRLGGLVELRDVSLVEEQEKFDEYANVLVDQMNAVMNTGASRPSRNELVSDVGFAVTDPFAGTGNVRIAITDNNGVVQSFTDIDLSTYTDINDLFFGPSGINTIAGIEVDNPLNPDGQIVMRSIDTTMGVSINELDSDVGAGNQGFSDFFGLNDLFRTDNGATNIRVADYLLADSDHLALGQLDGSAGLAPFDIGITVGDTRVIQNLSTALDAAVSFNAAGDFSSQSVSIRTYAESIMSRASLKASVAQDAVDAAEIIRQQGADFMNNVTGVNIDEETAMLLELESHYQASAQVISIIRGLLEELIAAVR